MSRRISIILVTLVYMILCCQAGQADLPKMPTRYTFSMAHQRISEALKRGQPVFWNMKAVPEVLQGYELSTLELLASIVQKMELSGVLQCNADGSGWLDVAALLNNQKISSFSQMTYDGRVGLQLNGEWFSTAKSNESLAMSMLSFDTLGESLLNLDYLQLRKGETPFITPLYQYGMRLWQLASPWAEDNNGLHVSSGATSHGITYVIDTVAARSILSDWADELSSDSFQYGFADTALSIGIKDETFQAFVEKICALSRTVELSTPLTFHLAFGEGDALRSAKGSGTLREGNKNTGISYRYTYDLSDKQTKQRYNVDYQPKEGDTLVLDLSIIKSSDSKASGEYTISLSANGLYDGLPYQIKYNSKLVNSYHLADNGLLTEQINGTITATVTYNKETIADISIIQESTQQSALGQKAVTIKDTYHTTIQNANGTIFQGPITLSLEIKENPEQPPLMEETQYIEAMDLIEIETLRETVNNAQATLTQNVLDVLSPVTKKIERGAY